MTSLEPHCNSCTNVRFSNSLSLLGFLHSTDSCCPLRHTAASETAAHTELVAPEYLLRSLLLMKPMAVVCAGVRLRALVLWPMYRRRRE